MSLPFLRSLSGGRLCVGCSDSSSISWVTASLWGLGNSRLNISQSPSAPSCPWEAWGSILPQEAIGMGPRQVLGVRLTVPFVKSHCYLCGHKRQEERMKSEIKLLYRRNTSLKDIFWAPHDHQWFRIILIILLVWLLHPTVEKLRSGVSF